MCLDTAYCGMKCRNDAWLNYHQWECPGSQMGLSQQIGIADLALKVFLTCSTTLDNERFNEVQKLVTNIEKLSAEDLLVYSIVSIVIIIHIIVTDMLFCYWLLLFMIHLLTISLRFPRNRAQTESSFLYHSLCVSCKRKLSNRNPFRLQLCSLFTSGSIQTFSKSLI